MEEKEDTTMMPEAVESADTVSVKQKFRDKFASDYPDVDMEDEDAYFGALNEREDKYAADRSRLDELESSQQAFGAAMDRNPRAAELFLEMTKDGGEPIAYLIEHYAKEFADMVNDPDNPELRDALVKKVAEDTQSLADREKMESEAQANMDACLEALSNVAGEMGLTDEQVADTFNKFVELTRDLIVDKVSEDTWRMFINGYNHDADVESARIEGETAGRNARITEKLRKEQPSVMSMGGSNSTGKGGNRPSVQPSITSSVWDEE